MSTYRVGCYYTESFTVTVEADSEIEASEKAYKILDDEGCPEGADVNDRDFGTCDAELQ